MTGTRSGFSEQLQAGAGIKSDNWLRKKLLKAAQSRSESLSQSTIWPRGAEKCHSTNTWTETLGLLYILDHNLYLTCRAVMQPAPCLFLPPNCCPLGHETKHHQPCSALKPQSLSLKVLLLILLLSMSVHIHHK